MQSNREPEPTAEADEAFSWVRRTSVEEKVIVGLARNHRRRQARRLGVIACMIAVLGIGFFVWPPGSGVISSHATATVTFVRSERLPDGSVVELREGADVRVGYGPDRRTVTLLRGEAFFRVAKDARRPFVVEAGAVHVRALGTAFTVERGTTMIDVLVTEGTVAVEKVSPTERSSATSLVEAVATVVAGNRVEVPTDFDRVSVTKPVPPEQLGERLSWRAAQIEFSDAPLDEVVALMNRHGGGARRHRFVLGDNSLRDLTLTGVLRADNVEGFLAILETRFRVRTLTRGDEVVLLRTP